MANQRELNSYYNHTYEEMVDLIVGLTDKNVELIDEIVELKAEIKRLKKELDRLDDIAYYAD